MDKDIDSIENDNKIGEDSSLVQPSPVTDMDNLPSQPIVDEVAQASAKVKKPKKIGKLLFILFILVSILIGAFSVWYFVYDGNINSIFPVEKKVAKVVVAESDQTLSKMISPTTGETWLKAPVAIEKQGWFKGNEYDPIDDGIDYYSVGSRGDNDIILAAKYSMDDISYIFEKTPAGEVSIISRPNAYAIYNDQHERYLVDILISSFTIDKDTHYDSLSIPLKIIIDEKGSFVTNNYEFLGYVYKAPSNNTTESVVKKLGDSTLYKSEVSYSDTGLTSVSYFIKTPFNTKISLEYEPLALNLSGYKWNSGEAWGDSGSRLKSITRGCGGIAMSSVTVIDDITDTDVQVAGASGDGLTVYEFKDSNNFFVQKAYNEYAESQRINGNGDEPVSLTDFLTKHAVVVYKDVNNQWLLYTRSDLSPISACAKPVVYLYPTTEQQVTVKVGANVTISDPLYNPSTGWIATAKPNGQLIVAGNNYGSLFWEGTGIGQYPDVASGTVVKKSDAILTIKKQLAQQGLNSTEISDFVEYWQDKLPAKPYIRLTWFNTTQMDNLAPLYISPKPDTTIRVFLDAVGLDKKVEITAQKLTKFARKGFTVVEWGGLLIGGPKY